MSSMPWTRLIESVICRRHAGATNQSFLVAESGISFSFDEVLIRMLLIGGTGGLKAEARCKGDEVQSEMAELYVSP